MVPRRQAHRVRLLGLARAEGREGAGQALQGIQGAQGNRLRHQRGAVPLLGPLRCRWAACAHLHVLDVASGRITRPVRRHARYELSARRPGRARLRHLARRPAHRVRLRSRRREAARQLHARWPSSTLRERPQSRRSCSTRPGTSRRRATARTARASRSSPRNHGPQAHDAARSSRCCDAQRRAGRCSARDWDHAVQRAAALGGRRRARSASPPSTAAAATSGASTLAEPQRRDRRRRAAGCIGSTSPRDTLVTVADAMDHPARVHARARRRRARAHRALQRRAARDVPPRRGRGGHGHAARSGDAGADVARLPARLRPEEEVPGAAQHPRRPARGRRATTSTTAGTTTLFAAQGYVVACVNYHGSSGFGHAFLDSITHRWGELELQDVEAGTDWLLKQPLGRPQARLRHRRQLRRLHGRVDERPREARPLPGLRLPRRLLRLGARCSPTTPTPGTRRSSARAYWDDMAKVDAQSPHAFADAMKTPTLVIHGALDYRVPDQQGLAYYNTLKARGVDARLVWFPDENHWILKPRNSKLWYGEFFAWLRATAARSGAPAERFETPFALRYRRARSRANPQRGLRYLQPERGLVSLGGLQASGDRLRPAPPGRAPRPSRGRAPRRRARSTACGVSSGACAPRADAHADRHRAIELAPAAVAHGRRARGARAASRRRARCAAAARRTPRRRARRPGRPRAPPRAAPRPRFTQRGIAGRVAVVSLMLLKWSMSIISSA